MNLSSKFSFPNLNQFMAGFIAAATLIIYGKTVAPTVSFWDCGEFIATSYRMGVPHPPGAPLYLLIARILTLIPFAGEIAYRVNFISVLTSSATVMLLYLVIVKLCSDYKGSLPGSVSPFVPILCGILGALTFAFTHSFWFNAVEAEVYAPSLFFMTLICWLILLWRERYPEGGHERILLFIFYLLGLAISIHLLSVLVLPFVALIYYNTCYRYSMRGFLKLTSITIITMLIIYPGIVKFIPGLGLYLGIPYIIFGYVIISLFLIWSYMHKKQRLSLIITLFLLVSAGYSTYCLIPIRSALNPQIDMNNPENIENFISYINREQYGNHSITDRRAVWENSPSRQNYSSPLDFMWNYQIKRMYIRYFLWQFMGMAPNGTDWSIKQFWGIPFLLGIVGLLWQARKSPTYCLSVFILFIMTGLAIVLYLNQPDPQPRERDYSYVGSFWAFSIWIGLGFAGIIEIIADLFARWNKSFLRISVYILFVILFVSVPLNMLANNYPTHDRSGNYLPRDFAYNTLMCCEPNAILFTYADNDTYPLWYLQEVEKIRTDVRVICLNLLQTDWHIRQLRDQHPTVPMRMTDQDIKKLQFIPWPKEQVILPVPRITLENSKQAYLRDFPTHSQPLQDHLTFRLKPTVRTAHGAYLGLMQQMILNIIYSNQWKKPIYFSATMPHDQIIGELSNYLRLDGMTYRLVPIKYWNLSSQIIRRNLKEIFNFRALDNSNIYYDASSRGILQHYRNAFIQLGAFYAKSGSKKIELEDTLRAMDQVLPEKMIPYSNQYLKLYAQTLRLIAGMSDVTDFVLSEQEAEFIGNILLSEFNHPDLAISILNRIYDPKSSHIKLLGLLLNAYQRLGSNKETKILLTTWLDHHPDDQQIKAILKQFEISE